MQPEGRVNLRGADRQGKPECSAQSRGNATSPEKQHLPVSRKRQATLRRCGSGAPRGGVGLAAAFSAPSRAPRSLGIVVPASFYS